LKTLVVYVFTAAAAGHQHLASTRHIGFNLKLAPLRRLARVNKVRGIHTLTRENFSQLYQPGGIRHPDIRVIAHNSDSRNLRRLPVFKNNRISSEFGSTAKSWASFACSNKSWLPCAAKQKNTAALIEYIQKPSLSPYK
jgi:hypothetical protein